MGFFIKSWVTGEAENLYKRVGKFQNLKFSFLTTKKQHSL